ncbi:hypothetical protein ALC62_13842 [Cyphomyrmex costatus]|uniref:Uncharacterized protein n=1 Tax=Cyphomyrmex costatus TaxID=456900 RepID=A0A195C3H1_9HYME|nr:hypothetical protein ALC62_13842 [Cyphomyrmex costatus]
MNLAGQSYQRVERKEERDDKEGEREESENTRLQVRNKIPLRHSVCWSREKLLYTLYLERAAERSKNRSFPLFQQPLSFSLPGRCLPLTEKSRQSVGRITANAAATITCLSERSHTLSRICTDPYG